MTIIATSNGVISVDGKLTKIQADAIRVWAVSQESLEDGQSYSIAGATVTYQEIREHPSGG